MQITTTPARIVLAHLAVFRLYTARAERLSAQLQNTLDTINAHISGLSERMPDLVDEHRRLKNRLRSIQKGVPIQEVEEMDTGPEPFEVTPSDAQACVRLWRILAKRLHPDSPGGDPQQFELARLAYKTRDLKALQHLYHLEFDFGNPFWVSANYTYAIERYERLQTQLAFLRETPDYQVARMAMQGQTDNASMLLEQIYQIRIANLLAQL